MHHSVPSDSINGTDTVVFVSIVVVAAAATTTAAVLLLLLMTRVLFLMVFDRVFRKGFYLDS